MAIVSTRMRIAIAASLTGFTATGCAQHYAGSAPRSPSEEMRPEQEPRRVAAPLDVHDLGSTPPTVSDPGPRRPRIRTVVTLGHSDAAPTYATQESPVRAAASVVTNITVVNQQPGFSGYWGGGGTGYRSFGYGSYGGYRSFSGSETNAYGSGFGQSSWGANPRSPSGVPLQVGGDWRPPTDYGPRPMR